MPNKSKTPANVEDVGQPKREASLAAPNGYAAPTCEWDDDEGKCTRPAIYRTHWYWNVCRSHGSLLMVNHGTDYLVDIEPERHTND